MFKKTLVVVRPLVQIFILHLETKPAYRLSFTPKNWLVQVGRPSQPFFLGGRQSRLGLFSEAKLLGLGRISLIQNHENLGWPMGGIWSL